MIYQKVAAKYIQASKVNEAIEKIRSLDTQELTIKHSIAIIANLWGYSKYDDVVLDYGLAYLDRMGVTISNEFFDAKILSLYWMIKLAPRLTPLASSLAKAHSASLRKRILYFSFLLDSSSKVPDALMNYARSRSSDLSNPARLEFFTLFLSRDKVCLGVSIYAQGHDVISEVSIKESSLSKSLRSLESVMKNTLKTLSA